MLITIAYVISDYKEDASRKCDLVARETSS